MGRGIHLHISDIVGPDKAGWSGLSGDGGEAVVVMVVWS